MVEEFEFCCGQSDCCCCEQSGGLLGSGSAMAAAAAEGRPANCWPAVADKEKSLKQNN